jgi:hypothetical protein
MADPRPGPDFVVDVAVRGMVRGIELATEPDQVTAVLGSDFADDRRRAMMWRDFGLVE